MGKRGGRGGGSGGQRAPHAHRKNASKGMGDGRDRDAGAYDLQIGTSKDFETYYQSQNVLEPEEWDEFLSVAQQPLPTTFRVTSSRAASKAVNAHVEQEFVPFLSGVVYEGVQQQPPRKLTWYPGGHAWQLNTAKHVVRKSPEFAKFQQFLVHETDSGNISRQEAVSMIPPLLLGVEPHHFVLDCCAAPGSKTTQLLEALHARTAEGESGEPLPAGILIANDSDAKRCHMLVHQSLNRVGSPNTMITNLDASAIPTLYLPAKNARGRRALQFDRILCDVPCSGDGTTRKNPNIWKTWKPADGLGLHLLQLRILLRAIQMLKPGGRLVYSTCSYNPIENEAVVSAALNACPDMSLIEATDQLPGLQRRRGLTTWKVYDKRMQMYATRADYEGPREPRNKGEKQEKPVADSCWPSGNEAELGLDKCLRLYPHLQDTGGFFVALLEKAGNESRQEAQPTDPAVTAEAEKVAEEVKVEAGSAEVVPEAAPTGTKRPASPFAEQPGAIKKAKTATATPSNQTPKGSDDEAEKREGGGRPFNEEPYAFLAPDNEEVKKCINFFELSKDFPSDSLFVRNQSGEALRSIYVTSPTVKSVIDNNSYTKMRLVSCGVKLFARQDSSKDGTYACKWRILQDGMNVISNYMGPRRKTTASLKTLRKLVETQYPGTDKFEDDVEFSEAVKALDNGSFICEFQPGEESGGRLENSITLPLWKAPVSLCLMVEKMEKRGISMRIFGEDISALTKEKGKKQPRQDDSVQNGDAPAPASAADEAEKQAKADEQPETGAAQTEPDTSQTPEAQAPVDA